MNCVNIMQKKTCSEIQFLIITFHLYVRSHTRYEHWRDVGVVLVGFGVPEGCPAHSHNRLVCAGTVTSNCNNICINLVYIHLERKTIRD